MKSQTKNNKFQICKDVKSLYHVQNKVDISLKWVQNYSKFKIGHWKSLILWEKSMTKMIKKEIGKEIKTCPEEWLVIIKRLWRIPSASFNLAKDISEKLHLNSLILESIIPDSKLAEGDYSKLSTKKQRIANIKDVIKYNNSQFVNNKNIIFIDDSYVSGTILAQIKNLTFSKGAKAFYPFVIADLSKTKNYAQENILNQASLEKNKKVDLFTEILNDPHSIITTKLICYFSELNEKDLQRVCKNLSKIAIKRLNNYAIFKKKDNISRMLDRTKKSI